MKHLLNLGILALMLSATAPAQDFQLKLQVSNAQVADLILGCRKDATDGMDQKHDIPVPPFGMGCGTVSLRVSAGERLPLYQDLRSPKLPQTWTVCCAPATGKPLVISWKKTQLPKGLDMLVTLPNGRQVNMNTRDRVTLTRKGTVTILAQPQAKKK